MKNILKGDIYYANLDPVLGCEQGGQRPVLIIQNNIGNKYSPTVIIAPITSQSNVKTDLPTHVFIPAFKKIKYNSVVLIEQIRVIDKKRLYSYLGNLNTNLISKIDNAVLIAFRIDLGGKKNERI